MHSDTDVQPSITFADYDEQPDEEQSSSVVPNEYEPGVTRVAPELPRLEPADVVHAFGLDQQPRTLAAATATTTAPNVRFPRALTRGMTGWDVRAHKRAVSRAFPSLYPWPEDGKGFTDYFGESFEEALQGVQRRTNILATGKIGSATHEMLERRHRDGHPSEWAFDARAIELAHDFAVQYAITPEERRRHAAVAACDYWVSRNPSISYAQQRPMTMVKPPSYDPTQDCSQFVTEACFAAGIPDPNGLGYNGTGYTGTLMDHTLRCAVYDLEPGDLIFFGSSASRPGFPAGSPTHVAMYVGIRYSAERGRNVRCLATMGSSADPRIRPIDYRHDLHHYAKIRA